MNWALAMKEIADRLDTMAGLRPQDNEASKPNLPAALVKYPDTIDPHGAYGRGMPRMSLQVSVLVGQPTARNLKELLDVWGNLGAGGVLDVLESGVAAGAYTAFDDLTVTEISFGVEEVGDVPYAAVIFDLDIAGSGV